MSSAWPTSADGTIAARFSDNVEFNFDDKDEVKEFCKKPYVYQNQFEIGSGHYTLKVAFSSGGESFGKLEMPLVVDSYDAKKFSMSAVALSKELRPLKQDSASLDAALLEDRTPLVAQGMEIVPRRRARFKKTSLAVFYAEIYDPGSLAADPPKLGVQMLVVDLKTQDEEDSRPAGPAGSAPAGTSGRAVWPEAAGGPASAGSYELQIRAIDGRGGATPVRTADFDVE